MRHNLFLLAALLSLVSYGSHDQKKPRSTAPSALSASDDINIDLMDIGSSLTFQAPLYLRKSPAIQIVTRGKRKLRQGVIWPTVYQDGHPLKVTDEVHDNPKPDPKRPYCELWPDLRQVIPKTGEVPPFTATVSDPPEVSFEQYKEGGYSGTLKLYFAGAPFGDLFCQGVNQKMTLALVSKTLGVPISYIKKEIPLDETTLKAVGFISSARNTPSGTGWIVGGNYALTAAHVVRDENGKAISDLVFAPNFAGKMTDLWQSDSHGLKRDENGRLMLTPEYAAKVARVERVIFPEEVQDNHIPSASDFALLRLSAPEKGKTWEKTVGRIPVVTPGEMLPFPEALPTTLVGYPFDTDHRVIQKDRWVDLDPARSIVEHQNLDPKNHDRVEGGESGGPVLIRRNGEWKALGIHIAAKDGDKVGYAIDSEHFGEFVERAIQQDLQALGQSQDEVSISDAPDND